MKNGVKWLMAGLVFGAAACSKEVQETPQPEDTVEVHFTIGTATGLDTRATTTGGTFSRGEQVDRLVYAVYDASGNLLEQFADGTAGPGQATTSVSACQADVQLTLVRNQTYTVAFWAQSSQCTAYNTEDLHAVQISYDGARCNDDTRDAFCKAETFTVVNHGQRAVTLTRPFAQINAGVAKSDYANFLTGWQSNGKSGAFAQTKLYAITPVATQFDVVTNSATGTASEVVFDWNTFSDTNTFQIKDSDEEYIWLAMAYILVDDTNESTSTYRSELTSAGIAFGDSTGDPERTGVAKLLIPDLTDTAPVQRNWSTNLILPAEFLLQR